ncbi:MAG: N-acetylmuramidase family protein [Dysgonamonadaceae bacterium]|jgi:hypothetical protein|nr:N-acetylmuramidase family protein [Dysgonamonadaceae bacterium]
MDLLRKGCQGRRVAELQEILKKQGYLIQPDGIFGQQTYLAVCQIQQKNGLTADGIVGKDTWNVIDGTGRKKPVTAATETPNVQITPPHYTATAQTLDVEEAAVRAVCEIESGGRTGFQKDGRPIILFEGHIFWRELKKRGVDPERYQAQYDDVLFPKWDKSKYKGGAAEYDRLNRAATINEEAALASASWGMFQIMGFNHKLCGYDTVREYVEAIKADSNNHLLSFAHFLKNSGIDRPLRNLDWAAFAERYNGPGYKQNQYDMKLQTAYLKYQKQLS